MHKILKLPKRVRDIKTFPHCDPRVLHSFGECEFCDLHPEWQELRVAWGIAFTGWEPDENELQDPATVARPLDVVNKWGGNRAVGAEGYDYAPHTYISLGIGTCGKCGLGREDHN
jgi:hypothetical protein